MNNQKTVKLLGSVFMVTILVAGISTNAQAQMYDNDNQYGYDDSYNNYYQEAKDIEVQVQKISCLNDNTNINGIDITEVPEDGTALAAANEEGANAQNGNGFGDKINFNKNLVNICVNVNVNEQSKISPPVEPQTASLTVNKEVFGCKNIITPPGEGTEMNCTELEDGQDAPDDPLGWRPCTDPAINETIFCEKLTENLFDIEVLDSQNTQLQEFEGSAQGTTIQNLQPGTYAVNETKNADITTNDLYVWAPTEQACVDKGFPDGGDLFNNINVPPDPTIPYNICFEYEDEQGNDCSTLTLAAGENKLCTVKNYIHRART